MEASSNSRLRRAARYVADDKYRVAQGSTQCALRRHKIVAHEIGIGDGFVTLLGSIEPIADECPFSQQRP